MSANDDIDFDNDTGEQPEPAECKFCGKAGLHWEETDAGWRLVDDNYKRHVCSNKTVAADFEDLTK